VTVSSLLSVFVFSNFAAVLSVAAEIQANAERKCMENDLDFLICGVSYNFELCAV
jgi:hypothetical protein